MSHLLFYPKFKGIDSNGNPLSGGFVYTYLIGTSTPKTTYSDYDCTTANANPVVLNSNGEANIYFLGGMKIVVKTSTGAAVWTMDNLHGADGIVLTGDPTTTGWGSGEEGTTWYNATSHQKKMWDGSKIVSVGEYGLYIDVRNYASINAAVTAIGSTKTTLVVSNSQTLTTNLTIPSTLSLKILQGGGIVKASTYTLTINGPFEAGPYQVFSGFAAGDVTFADGSVKAAYPEWWGGKGDNTTDSTTAILCAIASVPNGETIQFLSGKYLFSALSISKQIRLKGAGITARYVAGALTTTLSCTGAANGITIANSGATNIGGIFFEDLAIRPSVAGSGTNGLYINNSGAGTILSIELKNVDIREWGGAGVYSTGTVFMVSFYNCNIYENIGNGVTVVRGGGVPSQWTFNDSIITSVTGSTWAVNIDCEGSRFIGGTIAGHGTGNGLWVKSWGFVYGVSIEGISGTGTIGFRYTGSSGCDFCSNVFTWVKGVQVGDPDDKTALAMGLTMSGGAFDGNTTDIEIVDGGNRQNTVLINVGGNAPTISNLRESVDANYSQEFVILYKNLPIWASKTWDPPNLAADGDVTSTTITVNGAVIGHPVTAGLNSIGANNVLISAHVSSADTVTVIIMNKTGGALDIGSGTLYVLVQRKWA